MKSFKTFLGEATQSLDDLVDYVIKQLRIDLKRVSKEELKMGMVVELEHKDITNGDPILTAKIALAHLKELPDYYTRLKKMENIGKNENKKK